MSVWKLKSMLLCVCQHACVLNPHADECGCWGQRSDHHINEPFASNHSLVNSGKKSILPHYSSLLSLALNSFFLNRPTHTHSHTQEQKKTTMFPWRCLVGGERVEASVCSPVLPSAVSTLLSITSSFLSCHPPFIAFISHLFFKNKNISNIGKLYYKEGVA